MFCVIDLRGFGGSRPIWVGGLTTCGLEIVFSEGLAEVRRNLFRNIYTACRYPQC